MIDLHIGQIPCDPAEHLGPLFSGKQRFFPRIDHDANNELVKNVGGAPDDIQVPIGHRIKATGINGNFRISSSDCCFRKIEIKVFPY